MKSKQIQHSKSAWCLVAPSLFSAILFLILGLSRPPEASSSDLDPSLGSGGKMITSISPFNEPKNAAKRDIEEAKKAQLQETYGKLPLSFIQNDGLVIR